MLRPKVHEVCDAARDTDRDALFVLTRAGRHAGDVLAPAPAPAAATAGLHGPGRVEGVLIGGNLSLVAALLGTPWAWSPRGAILFLEDVNEELYRVDRLLTQLRLAGVLDAAAGFVLGSFSDAASPLALLRETLVPLGKPLLAGWPAGHATPRRTGRRRRRCRWGCACGWTLAPPARAASRCSKTCPPQNSGR